MKYYAAIVLAVTVIAGMAGYTCEAVQLHQLHIAGAPLPVGDELYEGASALIFGGVGLAVSLFGVLIWKLAHWGDRKFR